jgi:protein-S-isoprenylcysteine O-methyltransferase Ste14
MAFVELIGSGHKIGQFSLPLLIVAVASNIVFPAAFRVGGPPPVLWLVSILLLVPGLIIWIWSVVLIVTRVPRGELITSGPYALVKHPLYTGVALCVLPWVGFLVDTWVGAAMGLVIYIGSRRYVPEEDEALHRKFGMAWETYSKGVLIPWL